VNAALGRLAHESPGPQLLRRVPDGPDLESEGATGPGAGAGGGEEVHMIHTILDEKGVFNKITCAPPTYAPCTRPRAGQLVAFACAAVPHRSPLGTNTCSGAGGGVLWVSMVVRCATLAFAVAHAALSQASGAAQGSVCTGRA
jgi:hypothetical protein